MLASLLIGTIAAPAAAAPARSATAPASPLTMAAPTDTSATAVAAAQVTRLAGASRFETSVIVSRKFPRNVPVAFVALGMDFADALAGVPAATHLGGPLLLTRKDGLPTVVRDELRRLRPGRIIVLGGTGAVSDGVLRTLRGIAPTQRISGADRYATSQAVIDSTFRRSEHIALATGRGFADALSAGSAVAMADAPLLLVDGSRAALPSATVKALTGWGVKSIALAGGHGAIDIRIEQQLRTAGFDVSRVAGASRFETAVAVQRHYFADAPAGVTFLATGMDFPDALSAGALAGRLQAPLLLTRPDCVPGAAHEVLASATGTRFVVGGTGVVSNAAAANKACAQTTQPQPDFETTGWSFRADAAIPYSDRYPVNVLDPAYQLDSTGLRIYLRRDNNQRADHPVAYAQYGISALRMYQATGEQVWMDRAIRHAERLSQIRTERDGAWWFPYLFPWTYYQRTMTVPWWSGMAQGQALSLFVRLYEETADPRWMTAADKTWQSFLQPRSAAEPWSTMVDGGSLFFEEYAGNQPPLLVLNGQIFAIFGVYDYWRLTGDPVAEEYADGAATTVLSIMPIVRKPGQVSYYCVQRPYCQSPLWQNSAYHGIHSWQLDTLARLTGDPEFGEWAELLRADWQAPMLRRTAPGEILGWEDGPPQ